ncbi:MAG: tRNA lysidine(34) synthetase TilS [Cellvibrionaceae bacterium]
MALTKEILSEKLQHLPDTTHWVVGLSGGVDSVVLLHSLLSLELATPITAVHVNHGLSEKSKDWQKHCETLCEQWNIRLIVENVDVENQGKGIEDAARQVRYRVLSKHMSQGDVLLLGHHQDDQAETLLFRLMRGAGPYGLSAMDECRAFSDGYIARPFLSISKTELLDYANQNNLLWMEDESNRENEFDRNYLRNEVMPLLEDRWPNFAKRWQQTAVACQQADQMSHDLSLLDMDRCDEQRERWGYSLCFASLALLPRYRRHNLLRNWVRSRGFAIMEFKHLLEAEKQFFQAAVSGAEVAWSGTALRLFADRLFLTGISRLEWSHEAVQWSPKDNIELPDGSFLTAKPAGKGVGLKTNKQYEIRWREGGERCQPTERAHSQTLKKLLQEYGLEPWLRDRVPLIYCGGKLAAVGDLWVCRGFVAEAEELGCLIGWDLSSISDDIHTDENVAAGSPPEVKAIPA